VIFALVTGPIVFLLQWQYQRSVEYMSRHEGLMFALGSLVPFIVWFVLIAIRLL